MKLKELYLKCNFWGFTDLADSLLEIAEGAIYTQAPPHLVRDLIEDIAAECDELIEQVQEAEADRLREEEGKNTELEDSRLAQHYLEPFDDVEWE